MDQASYQQALAKMKTRHREALANAIANERAKAQIKIERGIERACKKIAADVRTETWRQASRATLASIYKNCPDEAMVIYIGQLMMGAKPLGTLSPEAHAARESALATAHAYIERVGFGHAIGVRPARI